MQLWQYVHSVHSFNEEATDSAHCDPWRPVAARSSLSHLRHEACVDGSRKTKGSLMALELRPNCECCDRDLPPDSTSARICSYECTFCADCVENVLLNVCPNCGGGFVPRPIRPATEWRAGLCVVKRPPSEKRRSLSYSREEMSALSDRLKDIPPEQR